MLARLAAVALASTLGTWLARRYALARRLVDEPGERRSHAVATPRGGGLGPVLAFAAVLAHAGFAEAGGDLMPAAALAGLLLVAGIGWWDDHRPLSAGVRLAVHVLAGVSLALGAGFTDDAAAAALLVLATVALVNVWNFMDGIDGLAASQAALVALGIGALGWPGAAWLPFALAAACIGFLPFNFPRARIFLGDVGSGALGYALACVAASSFHGPGRLPIEALLLPSAFLVDAGLTLLRRVLRRERWWTPHTQHLYQALARTHGHVATTGAYAAWTIAGVLLAVGLRGGGPGVTIPSVAAWYTAACLLWFVLQQRFTRKDATG